MVATFCKSWVDCLEGAGRWEAAGISFDTHCGIAQFEKYRRDDSNALPYRKYLAYQLLNCGQEYARLGETQHAFACLADAADLIDQCGLKEVLPKLYQNLALAFQAKQDWWRCLLAASASGALFEEIQR
jgi:hypothetical protein